MKHDYKAALDAVRNKTRSKLSIEEWPLGDFGVDAILSLTTISAIEHALRTLIKIHEEPSVRMITVGLLQESNIYDAWIDMRDQMLKEIGE